MLSSLLELVLELFLNSMLSDLLSQLFRILRPGKSKLPFPLKATCRISLSFGNETLFCFKNSRDCSLFSWFSIGLSLVSGTGWKSGSSVWNLMRTGVDCAVDAD